MNCPNSQKASQTLFGCTSKYNACSNFHRQLLSISGIYHRTIVFPQIPASFLISSFYTFDTTASLTMATATNRCSAMDKHCSTPLSFASWEKVQTSLQASEKLQKPIHYSGQSLQINSNSGVECNSRAKCSACS